MPSSAGTRTTATGAWTAGAPDSARLLELFALQHDQGPCVECYGSGAARTNIDLTSHAAATSWPRFALRAQETGYVATHALPLRLRSRIVGALNLFQTTPRRLGDDDVALAQALADVATIAILQQRTLEQSHVENSQLENALTSRILIEQVKGVLAERWGTSVDDAFAAFRTYARSRHLRLSELAGRIVAGSFDTSTIPAPTVEQAARLGPVRWVRSGRPRRARTGPKPPEHTFSATAHQCPKTCTPHAQTGHRRTPTSTGPHRIRGFW
ncbi:GAF and ANTAR domain-containing protein [Streptomyces sp. NPDC023838]|uniref:GAF and ANTAR domain-containing protein n=1 Tax=Streptomyces sp. NPDC023838 TaxID=3154325 RepID=UPI0033E084BD